MVSYYVILGISETATEAEIKSAYKRQAVQYHPDKHQGNSEMEERFKEINAAYQVLSNPYERARHDLQIKFGYSSETYAQPETYTPPVYRKKRDYAPREIDWKENARATAYAFGFTFFIAIIVMSGIGLKTLYDNKQLDNLLLERRTQFDSARYFHSKGELEATFNLINGLGAFMDGERDMMDFKDELVKSVQEKGVQYFKDSEFESAVYFIELLERHTEVKTLSLKENLAVSYRELDQPEKSIEVYTQLLMLGYRNLSTYVEMAHIYRDELKDMETALSLFEKANEVAKNYYKSIWGEAYIITLSGNQLSEVHWDLYTGLANMYLLTGYPEKAVDATRWNIQVWPNRSENFMIASKGYESLGNIDMACERLYQARIIDPSISPNPICL